MRPVPVPITMGSERFTSLETDSFRVTEAWFPPGRVLEPHTHDRAIFSVMLGGGLRTHIAQRTLACDAGFAWTEPLGEKHANYCGAQGAHLIVIQPDEAKDELLRPVKRLVGEVHLLRQAHVTGYALRILAELRDRDAFSALSVEALATMLLADSSRRAARDGNGHRPPGWLLRARDILHAEWRAILTVSHLARTVGVNPMHLARTFRRHYGQSVGSYVRALRLEWALAELAASEQPISHIACAAGFSDQSHFTRECKKRHGVTPGLYRSRLHARNNLARREHADAAD